MATDTIDWLKALDDIDKNIQEFRERKRRASVQMISKSADWISKKQQLDKGIAASASVEVRKLQEETAQDNAPFDDLRLDVFVDIQRLADQLMVAYRSLTREQAVAQAEDLQQRIYDSAVLMQRQSPDLSNLELMQRQSPDLSNLELEDFVLASAMSKENELTEAEMIAKRFEKDPGAYEGSLFQDPSQNDFYQSEVRRLADISKITQPQDHTGKKIAADAAGRLAKKLQAQDPSLSDVDALSKAYEQQPQLYMR
jgi:hypothetical protein